MVKVLPFLIFAVFSTEALRAESVLELLTRKIEPPQVCEPPTTGEKIQTCVRELCDGTQTRFPMIINDLDAYLGKQDYEVNDKVRARFEAFVSERIKKLNELLDDFEAANLDDALSDDERQAFLLNQFAKKCLRLLSPEKKLRLDCQDELLRTSPMKGIMEEFFLAHMKQNWDVGLKSLYYSPQDIPALMTPEWKLRTQKLLQEFKEDFPNDYEFLMNGVANYQKLDYVDQMRFVKTISQLDKTEIGTVDAAEANKLFKAFVTSADFKAKLARLRQRLADPKLKETALASLEIQNLLENFGPTVDELIAWDKVMKEVKDQVLASQREQVKAGKMSSESYAHYQKELNNVHINYRSEQFNTQWVNSSNFIFGTLTHSLDQISADNPQYLYNFLGATLGAPIGILSEQYLDPRLRDLTDPNFHKSEVKVSIFSIKNPAHGKLWLAHELGHHLSFLGSQGRLSKLTAEHLRNAQSCIRSRFQSPEAGNLYMEEEFADEFAFSMAKASDQNISCPMLRDIASKEFVSLELMKIIDTHNTYLWRALNQYQATKKKLPPACAELVQAQNAPYKYRSCLK